MRTRRSSRRWWSRRGSIATRAARTDLPKAAAWQHRGAREGFEVVFPRVDDEGFRFHGLVAAVEDDHAWGVRYTIDLDRMWTTRRAHVRSWFAGGEREIVLERDDVAGWRIDAVPAPRLAGLVDVDLEASAFTNAFPVQRLRLGVGEHADAPATYVRQPDLRVERLEQRYRRLQDDADRRRYAYEAPAFTFDAVLAYDEHGFVVDYPGIAARVL